MIAVEPRVYLLAEPKLDWTTIAEWLVGLGVAHPEIMALRMSGSDAERLVELAARRCYKSFEPGLNPNVTKIREDSREYHENILKSGHGSVLEHSNFTFAFEFVSRVFTHELVRHRAGCAYSQESLRYVRLTELGFWMPPEIARNDRARVLFEETVETLEKAQEQLMLIFSNDMEGNFSAKKALTSAFRRIAPEGLATGIVATFNARALRHIVQLRTSFGAETEIRGVLGMVADTCKNKWSYLFQDIEPDHIGGWSGKYGKV